MLQTIVVGNLAADAEMSYTQDGTARARFRVMHNPRPRKGQPEAPAVAVGVTIWRKHAESLTQYLTKGTQVFVQGDLTVGTFQGKDGTTRVSLDLEGEKVLLLGGKREQGSNPSAQHAVEYDTDIPF